MSFLWSFREKVKDFFLDKKIENMDFREISVWRKGVLHDLINRHIFNLTRHHAYTFGNKSNKISYPTPLVDPINFRIPLSRRIMSHPKKIMPLLSFYSQIFAA